MELSLRNWPDQPLPARERKLSPLTIRTFEKAKVEIDSAIPISTAQFRLFNNLGDMNNSEFFELYEQDRKRRQKKVQILLTLWQKIKSKSDKKKCFSSSRSSMILKRQHNLTQRVSTKSFGSGKKNKPSPALFKAGSPKKSSAYFDYYSSSKEHKKFVKKITNEDESTKSLRKNGDYYDSSQTNNKQNKSPSMKNILLDAMNDIMRKWSEMDCKHTQEIAQLSNVSDREKKRLLKIHQIEKQKLRLQIQNVKAYLATNKKLSKHFL